MKFSELELNPALSAALEKLNFVEMTPVQAATMPHVLEGRDVAGLAQTGTGKTAAFLLPLMDRILTSRLKVETLSEEAKEQYQVRAFPEWKPRQFVLILVPTRELAEQVYEHAMTLKGESGLRAVSIYGGVSYDKQKQGLKDGVEIVVATPGRLIDLYKEHLVDLKQVRAIVFDEADRMFDMGFKDDMKYILQRVPTERQFLVFSATLNLDVLSVAYQFGSNPIEVDVSRDQAKAENVEDKIFHVGHDEKPSFLLSLFKKLQPRQAIVFSNFKMNVPRITQFLNANGVPAVGISSLLTQAQRTRVMEQFKGENNLNVMVATDVAARGLDIKGVDLVINFELPDDAENYVHRIGRTGRAGEKGKAFSLVSDRDVEALTRVEEYLRHKVDVEWFEDSEIIKDHVAFPSESELRRAGQKRPEGRRERERGDRGRREGRNEGRFEGRDGRRGDRDRDRGRRSEQRPQQASQGAGRIQQAGGDQQRRPDQRPQSQQPRGEHQHRDRVMGRHKQQQEGGRGDQQRQQQPRGQQQGGQRRDFDRNRNRPQGGKQRPQQGAQAKQQAGKGAGVGQKVAGFFKKLFGKK